MTRPATIRRFAFDTEFDASGAILRQGARLTNYSIEEVEIERATAYEQGKEDETARAQAQLAQAVSAIAQATHDLTQAVLAERRAMLCDAARLSLAIARKIAGAALETQGIARISAALEDAFDSILGAPRVIVRLSPALEGARAHLEEVAKHSGFDGVLVVRPDPSIRLGDVTLDWGDGAVIHDSAESYRKIEELVMRQLDASQDERNE